MNEKKVRKLTMSVDGYMSSSLELVEDDQRRLLENSIERVINNAIQCLSEAPARKDGEDIVAEDDLRELKRLMTRIWTSAQSAVFAGRGEMKD